MVKNKIIELNINDINLNNDLFRFSYPDENKELEKSISNNGFTCPISVKEEDTGKLQIISGFRRVIIAKKINYSKIPAIIISKNNLDCFKLGLDDTLSQRGLNIFEASIVVDKLIRVFGIPQNEAESVYLPLLGYHPNKKILDNLLFINNFSDSQREKLFCLNIEPEKLFVFKLADKSIWDSYIEILSNLHPSANKFKQIIELVKELAQRNNVNEIDILQSPQIKSIITDSTKNSSQNLNLLRIYLEQKRNPIFTKINEYYSKNISLLKMNNNIKLNHPSNFEGTQYSININFKNKDDLKKAVSNLHNVCDNPVLDKIMNPLEQLADDEII